MYSYSWTSWDILRLCLRFNISVTNIIYNISFKIKRLKKVGIDKNRLFDLFTWAKRSNHLTDRASLASRNALFFNTIFFTFFFYFVQFYQHKVFMLNYYNIFLWPSAYIFNSLPLSIKYINILRKKTILTRTPFLT